MNGKPEGSLALFSSTNSGNNWTFRGGSVDPYTNQISEAINGTNLNGRWTIGSGYQTSQIKVTIEGLYNSSTNRMNRKDTVRAYLRNSLSPYAIVDSAKSVIDSITLAGNFTFVNAPSGTYYVVVKHRNSIETWSKAGGEVYNLGSAFSYDFTTASNLAYGINMIQVDASPVKFGIYSGDVDQLGQVDLTYVLAVYNDANSFVTGYKATDLNGDRVIDLTDIVIGYNNSILFVSVVRP